MIAFIRKFRRQLLSSKSFSKYLLNAVGEIVLEVIGILIALEINNNNDLEKEREKELHYLENIKSDLNFNLQELDRYIGIRNQCIGSARSLQRFGHAHLKLAEILPEQQRL